MGLGYGSVYIYSRVLELLQNLHFSEQMFPIVTTLVGPAPAAKLRIRIMSKPSIVYAYHNISNKPVANTETTVLKLCIG